jgi:hypothetical protein
MHPLKTSSFVKKARYIPYMKIARGIKNLMPAWGHYPDGCLNVVSLKYFRFSGGTAEPLVLDDS